MHVASHPSPAPALRRVAVIGGVDRAFHLLAARAASLGVVLEHHHGRVAGHEADRLASVIHRADAVVIVTDVNSHNAVVAARRLAVAAGLPHVLVRRLGPGRVAGVLAELGCQR